MFTILLQAKNPSELFDFMFLTLEKNADVSTYLNKMKNKKYHTVRTIPKSNIKILERGNIDAGNTQIHDRSLSWLGTDTLIKSCWVKLVLWVQTSPHSQMMRYSIQ